jgi:hypothetical protein
MSGYDVGLKFKQNSFEADWFICRSDLKLTNGSASFLRLALIQ